jgi:hypothetical protein
VENTIKFAENCVILTLKKSMLLNPVDLTKIYAYQHLKPFCFHNKLQDLHEYKI